MHYFVTEDLSVNIGANNLFDVYPDKNEIGNSRSGTIVDADGNKLAGRNARTGPNLYGVAGMVPGTVDGFRYGDSIVEYGEAGGVWNEEHFVAWVQAPTDFLKEQLDDRRARARMSYQVRDEQQAYDIYAYLASLAE